MSVRNGLILALVGAAFARGENFGLREPQPAEQLPVSRAALVPPTRKPGAPDAPMARRLEALDARTWRLAGGWRLIEADAVWPASASLFDPALDVSAWLPATVPGTVLTTLVEQGVYPDPYFGLNNLAIPERLCRTEWLYRTVFDAPAAPDGTRTWLLMNGVNYRAAVYVNGVRLGEMAGAFVRGLFDLTPVLRARGNVLAVRVYPPPNPGIPHEESARTGQGPNGGQLCLDGPTFIASEGWDWVPGIRDRNMGVWQDVRLRVTGDLTLADPQVLTDLPLPATDRADVTVRVQVRNAADQPRRGTVTLRLREWPGAALAAEVELPVEVAARADATVTFSPRTHSALALAAPRLWWPNGYGEPNLYRAEVSVAAEGRGSDALETRFGVREFSYNLSVDTPDRANRRVELNPLAVYADGRPLVNNADRREVEGKVCIPRLAAGADASRLADADDLRMGPYLVVRVNGVPIFCRGGNWGMDDALKRVSRARLEPALRLHRAAGFTMVRNWTGESTEPEFFELCDELGLLVWNDFWYSTQTYNLEPNDHDLFLANARETVRRYRNHASVAIWCPRNEGWANEQLEPRLAALLAAEDPSRHYHGNSRLQNLRPSGPWRFIDDVSEYFTKLGFGFNTELGSFAVPTFETLRTFMAAEDLWPIGDVWHYHDFHTEQNQAQYRKAIAARYGEPADAEAFCKRAQLVNYDSFRAIFEAWNSRLWENASGLLLWMSHPAWPSTIWQLYSYDYETTGAYYGAKKACEPVHVQMNASDRLVLVVNATRQPLAGASVRLACYALDGRACAPPRTQAVSAAANAKTVCFQAEPPQAEGPVLARLTLVDAAGSERSRNEYWLPGREQFRAFAAVAERPLETVVLPDTPAAAGARVRVTNRGGHVLGAIRVQVREARSGARVLPACVSDGWFSLLPGEAREVTLDGLTARELNEKGCRVSATCDW